MSKEGYLISFAHNSIVVGRKKIATIAIRIIIELKFYFLSSGPACDCLSLKCFTSKWASIFWWSKCIQSTEELKCSELEDLFASVQATYEEQGTARTKTQIAFLLHLVFETSENADHGFVYYSLHSSHYKVTSMFQFNLL